MRKWLGWFTVGFLVLVAVLFSGNRTSAHAEDLTSKVAGVNEPSKVEVQNDGYKIVKKADDGSYPDFNTGQQYRLSYTWSIKDGQEITKGDTVTVSFPKTSDVGAMNFNITDSDKQVVGSFESKKGASTGTITFNDVYAKMDKGRSGNLTFADVTGTITDSSGSGGGETLINKNGWVDDNTTYTTYGDSKVPNTVVWNVVLNTAKKNLGNVILTDKIGDYQSYEKMLYINQDGKKLTSTPTVKVSDDKRHLEIDLANVTSEIEIAYTVKVDTETVHDLGQKTLTNTAGFESSSGSSGDTGSGTPAGGKLTGQSSHIVNLYKGSGDANGYQSVTLTKTNEEGHPVAGAVYELQKVNEDGTTANISGKYVTDVKGHIQVPELAFGNYQFVETKAPNGYLKDGPLNTHKFSVGVANGPVDVPVTDPYNSVTLTKRDALDHEKVLAGATYTLMDETGKNMRSYTTNDQGQLVTSKLNPGNYYFVEESAPEGYVEDKTPITFTISEDQVGGISKIQYDSPNSNSSSVPSTSSNSNSVPRIPSVSSSSDNVPSTPSTSSNSVDVPSAPSASTSSVDVPSAPSASNSSVDVPSTPSASTSSVDVPSASLIPSESSPSRETSASSTSSDFSESSSGTSTNASHNGSNGGNPSDGSSTKTSSADVVNGGNDADGGDGNQPQSGGGVPVAGNGGHGDGSRGSGISRLPQTNDDQKATALFLGILMLGGTLSYVQWRRNRS